MSRIISGQLIPSIIGAVGVTLWATETTLVNLVRVIPPLEIVTLAFAFAAMMSPFVWMLTGENPFDAFKLPKWVWMVMVLSLVGYHSCIYFATQRAPAAPAALLQGTTPLLIVLGSAFLPGERLRWWHIVGAGLGFCGVALLIDTGGTEIQSSGSAIFYLSLIGTAAGLWGLYSVITRSLVDVPTSSLGMFYAASAVLALFAHLSLESWITPSPNEWLAIAGLGIFPMGLAIYLWDYGVKRGDIQALGVFSYAEPFIGAALVALVTGAAIRIDFVWSAGLVVTGAIVASASLWKRSPMIVEAPSFANEPADAQIETFPIFDLSPESVATLNKLVQNRMEGLSSDPNTFLSRTDELIKLLLALKNAMALMDEFYHKNKASSDGIATHDVGDKAA